MKIPDMIYKILVPIVIALMAMCEKTSGQISTPLTNAVLKTDATGANAYGWTNMNKVGLGNGTPTSFIQLFPAGTTAAEGIKFGTDSPALSLHRSASKTLTLTGDLVVTGSVTAGSLGNFATLNGSNTWSGTNVFSASATFNSTTTIGTSGLSFSGSGASNTRTALSLVPGTNVQAYSAPLQSISDIGTPSSNYLLLGNGSVWTAASPSTVRTALSLVPGVNVQAYSANLASVAAVSPSVSGDVLVSTDGASWTKQNGSSLRSTLGLAIGTNVQAYNSQLATIAGLGVTSGNIMVANGSTWTAQSGSTARTSLGLGTGDSPQFTSITVQSGTGGTSLNDTYAGAGVLALNLPTTTSIGTPYLALTDSSSGLVNLSNSVTGSLGVTAGGTGKTSVAQDKLLYTSGANTFAETSITALGRTLLSKSTAADWLSELGSGIGSGVQAYSPYLQSITDIGTPSANYFMVGNGSVWTKKSPSDSRTALALGGTDNVTFGNVTTASGSYVTSGANGTQPAFISSGSSTVFGECDGTADSYKLLLKFVDPTANRNITFPDATGTVALTSQANGSITGADISSGSPTFTGITTGTITASGAVTGWNSGSVIVVDPSNSHATNTRTGLDRRDQFRPFTTIQAALTAAVTGDTIVLQGTTQFIENLTATNKKLIIYAVAPVNISGSFMANRSDIQFRNVSLTSSSGVALTLAGSVPPHTSMVTFYGGYVSSDTAAAVTGLNADGWVVLREGAYLSTAAVQDTGAASGGAITVGTGSAVYADMDTNSVVNFEDGSAYYGVQGTATFNLPTDTTNWFGLVATDSLKLRNLSGLSATNGTHTTTVQFDTPGADRTVHVPDQSGTIYVGNTASPTAGTSISATITLASSLAGGSATYIMPAATSSAGRVYTIKNVDPQSDDVVIHNSGDGATFDGSSTYTLANQYDFVTLTSDGTNWFVIAKSP